MNENHKSVFSHVLTVGPDYKNHRGGIGAVLEIYHHFFEPFHFIPTYNASGNNWAKSLFFLKQLYPLIKKLKNNKAIRIVHIHGSHSGSFYRKLLIFLISKKLFHKQVMYHLHSSSFDTFYAHSGALQKTLIRYMMSRVDMVVCLSPSWKNFYEQHFKCKSIKIINNVVNAPDATVLAAKKEVSDAVYFLFLGRIGDRKGIFDLLQVLSTNKAAYLHRLKLYVGGDGETDKLQQLIAAQCLKELVEYIGWVSDEQKLVYLLKSDVYILPSYSEGLPISILEAMSYGLPILSTLVGGIPEVVEDNVNGLLFNPGDTNAMKDAIDYILNHPEKREAFGKASLLKITPYLPVYVAQQLTSCYTELLNE